MPTLREVFDRLGIPDATEARAAALAAAERESAPWFVRLFVGCGTWVGAAILTFFLAAADLFDERASALGLGVVLLAGAFFVSRRLRETVFTSQLTWVLAIGGEAAILAGVEKIGSLHHTERTVTWAAFLLQVLLLAAIPQRLFRLFSAICLAGTLTALTFVYRFDGGVNLAAVVLAAVLVLLWLHESRLASRWGGVWSAGAHGLAVGLAIPLIFLVNRGFFSSIWLQPDSATRLAAYLTLPAWVTVALALLAAWAIAVAFAEQGRSLASRAGLLTLGGLAILTVLTLQVPGLLAGLLLLVLAHLRGDRALHVLALLYVGGFLFAFYYQLHVPLLEKSLWMLAAGALLLVLYALLRRAGEPRQPTERAVTARRRQALAGLGLALALALALPAYAIWSKERVLASGRTVLLRLAPVDPRSLIQGDYMALSYALAQQVPNPERLPRTGRLVLRLSPGGVASFAGLHRGEDLAPGEQLLRYRVRDAGWRSEIRLGAESYFFEEGTAGLYARAAYGELKVGRDGDSVLVGLRDDRLRPLGRRLH